VDQFRPERAEPMNPSRRRKCIDHVRQILNALPKRLVDDGWMHPLIEPILVPVIPKRGTRKYISLHLTNGLCLNCLHVGRRTF
jgi:hypothetical protein